MRLFIRGLQRPGDLEVKLNDQPLANGKMDGEWLKLPVPAAFTEQHKNRIALQLAHGTAEVRDLMVVVRFRKG